MSEAVRSSNASSQHAGARFVTDLIFELQTIPHFLGFALSGVLPGDQNTTLPLFPKDLLYLWNQPYSEWALDPLHELTGTPNKRVMILMGSFEDPSRLVPAEVVLDHTKSKLWEGMGLMSDTWWLTKKLDDQANVKEAVEYINRAIGVFRYLQMPQIQANMRDTYNLVRGELSSFQDAINALRREMDEPPVQITALFEEFIRSTFSFMERQARDWIFHRLKGLRATVYQTLLELGLTADQKVRVPIDGFKGLASPETRPSNTDTQSRTSEQLTAMYVEREKQRKDERDTVYAINLNAETTHRHAAESSPMPEWLEPSCILFDRDFALIKTQPAIDVYPTKLPETWIRNLAKRPNLTQFGFVAYRISHAINDQDWASFLKKLEAGMNAWSGVAGSDLIKSKAKLQWLDGKDLNIADGDIEAVRNHFCSFSGILPGMETSICLAVDAACIDAFNATTGPRELRTGHNADYRGYLLAVDCNYTPDNDMPDYKGVVRIVDQLIWTDLYAFRQMQSHFLNELWLLAVDHPSQVYVGPTVGIQTARWQRKKAELGRQ